MHNQTPGIARAVQAVFLTESLSNFPRVTTDQAAKIRETFAIIKERNAQ